MNLTHPLPIINRLLAGMPAEEYQRFLSGLELVQMTFGDVLHEAGDAIQYLYFPNDSVISLLAVADDRMTLEVGLVGSEGLIGIAVAMGIDVSPVRALVQKTGTGMRIRSDSFRDQLSHSPGLQQELNHYSHGLLAQATQTAFCGHFHLLEARLARSLLMTRERVKADEFHLTHEFLAQTLGVRRVGVTKAASALQNRKLITYARGNIKIIDLEGLEAASCSCHQIMKAIGAEPSHH
ncbi:MAG: Crp/Fnr family transcriptional regulator [Pseudomonadota bacterium]